MHSGVCVMGPVRVVVHGAEHAIASRLRAALLSRLVLETPNPVSTDQLIEALWGDQAPRTARKSIHVQVNGLRTALRETDDIELVTIGDYYRLDIDQALVDVHRIERLVEEGLDALSFGQIRKAHDLLSDCIAQWATPYEALLDDPSSFAERHRLDGIRQEVTDAINETLLQLGDSAGAARELRGVIASRPLRARPYEQLIRAYLDLGQHAEAHQVHATATDVYEFELGSPAPPTLAQLLRADEGGSNGHTPPNEVVAIDALAGRVCDATTRDNGSVAVFGCDTIDIESFNNALSAAARTVANRPTYVFVTAHDGDLWPLSPLVNLVPTIATDLFHVSGGQLRRQNRLAAALTAKYGEQVVIVVHSAQHLGATTSDFIAARMSLATATGPRFVLCFGGDKRRSTVSRLAGLCRHHVDATSGETPAARPMAPPHHLDSTHLASTHLDSAQLRLFELASYAGGAIPVDVLVRATKLEPSEARRGLTELLDRKVLVSPDVGRVAISPHASPESPPRSDMHIEKHIELHIDLADAYRDTSDDAGPYRWVAECRHRLAAAPAGDADARQLATAQAATWLDSLGAHIDLADLIPEPDPHDDLDVAVMVGRAQMRTGHPQAVHTLMAAIEVARACHHASALAAAVCALCEQRAPQSMDELRTLQRAAIDALRAAGEDQTDVGVQLMTDLANGWYFTDPATAERLALDAVAVAESTGSSRTIARSITGLVQATMRPDTAPQRLDLAVRAQAHARGSDSTESHVLALMYEVSALVEMGRLDRVHPPLQYARALAEEVQAPRVRWWVLAWQALVNFATGEYPADPDQEFRQAFESWKPSDRSDPLDCLAAQIAAHRLVSGRAHEIVDLAEQAYADRPDQPFAASVAAACTAASGAHLAARRLLHRFLIESPLPDDAMTTSALALFAQAAVTSGDESVAPALLERIAPLVDLHAVVNVWGGGGFYGGSMRHAHGLALQLAGRQAEAITELRQAARQQAAVGAHAFAQRSADAATQLER